MKSAAILLLTLSTCTVVDDTTKPPTHLIGRTVQKVDSRIWVIHQDHKGDYWFGSNGNGVYRYDGQVITHYTKADGLSGHQVRDIREDAKGNVFISTTNGVCKFDGKTFTNLEPVEPPAGSDGWVLRPDDVWIVFDPGGYGVVRYDGEKLYHLKLPKSPIEEAHRDRFANAPGFFSPTSVYSVYKDRRGHMWFGTAAVGLCRFDGQTLSWMYEEHLTTTPRGGAFGIRSVYEDKSGDFWICNTRHRFSMAPEAVLTDGYSRIQYEKKQGLPDARSDTDENFRFYPSVTEDDAGSLWMACGNTVLKYDGKKVSRYAIADGAYAANIRCDRAGKLWVGTIEHGIYTFEDGRMVSFHPN